jgi:hypothetical protein
MVAAATVAGVVASTAAGASMAAEATVAITVGATVAITVGATVATTVGATVATMVGAPTAVITGAPTVVVAPTGACAEILIRRAIPAHQDHGRGKAEVLATPRLAGIRSAITEAWPRDLAAQL